MENTHKKTVYSNQKAQLCKKVYGLHSRDLMGVFEKKWNKY